MARRLLVRHHCTETHQLGASGAANLARYVAGATPTMRRNAARKVSIDS